MTCYKDLKREVFLTRYLSSWKKRHPGLLIPEKKVHLQDEQDPNPPSRCYCFQNVYLLDRRDDIADLLSLLEFSKELTASPDALIHHEGKRLHFKGYIRNSSVEKGNIAQGHERL